jgi:hypothetical protein
VVAIPVLGKEKAFLFSLFASVCVFMYIPFSVCVCVRELPAWPRGCQLCQSPFLHI